jgi:hypothetical protein
VRWRYATFAVLSHRHTGGNATVPAGVVYAVSRWSYVRTVAANTGWKARHIAIDGNVAVTVP